LVPTLILPIFYIISASLTLHNSNETNPKLICTNTNNLMQVRNAQTRLIGFPYLHRRVKSIRRRSGDKHVGAAKEKAGGYRKIYIEKNSKQNCKSVEKDKRR
jgi:hypothetical protein